jgi:transcriptional regulator with XRE-family HTH domain
MTAREQYERYSLVKFWRERCGLTFREIGERLGVTHQEAHRLYKAATWPTDTQEAARAHFGRPSRLK